MRRILGVNLWNASTLIRGAQNADAELFATRRSTSPKSHHFTDLKTVRLAGYRLIVAGMDHDAPPKGPSRCLPVGPSDKDPSIRTYAGAVE